MAGLRNVWFRPRRFTANEARNDEGPGCPRHSRVVGQTLLVRPYAGKRRGEPCAEALDVAFSNAHPNPDDSVQAIPLIGGEARSG
jgi:hypothetical protein